jgi:YegS/Rv2252/BmrU family lipid kinase
MLRRIYEKGGQPMKHLFVINPVAGKGKAIKCIPEIQEIFKGREEQYNIEITQYPGHATEIVRSFISREACTVYSVGGDGTLNEVLNGMAESGSTLAVIPGGSGNDFIRSLNCSSDTGSLLLRTVNGRQEAFDLAKVNGRYFINIASLGFDGDVVFSTLRFKNLPGVSGSLAYILGIFYSIFKRGTSKMRITVDGSVREDKMLLTAIANGRYYGGGMIPVPDADLKDGFLDICAVREVSRLKILRLLPKYMKGKHGSLKEVSFYRGRQIRIECDREVSLNVDGEVQKVREAVFEVIPGGITLLVPGPAEKQGN